jgi:hypothetical protein
MAQHAVQNATGSVCPLEFMPRLLIENVFLKSRINRAVQVLFHEELGVKLSLLTHRVSSKAVYEMRAGVSMGEASNSYRT